MSTPPPPGAGGQQGEASPATPAAAQQLNGKQVPLPLKSALKTRLRVANGDGGSGDATPLGAGIKKHVRIHSSSNLIHEFQASATTDELLLDEEEQEGAGHDSDGTPDSSSARPRRPRSRRAALTSLHGLLMVSLFGGSPRRGRRRRAASSSSDGGGSSTALGVLFTLCWMVASSALIFANKVLMVDLGFRFPCALTALGQLSSMLLGL